MKFFQLTTRKMPEGMALGLVLLSVEEARKVELEFVAADEVPMQAIRSLLEAARQSISD